jgi:Ni/Co efflux regulator RcnB
MATKKAKAAKKNTGKMEVAEETRNQIFDGKMPDETKPLVGEMVVIMGVPKKDNYNARTIIPAIGEAVRNAYDFIDVVKIKDVNLHAPLMFAKSEGDEEMLDYINSGEGKALMALFIHQDRQQRLRAIDEEDKNFDEMSPEEQQRMIERVRHLRKESNEAAEKRRLEAVEHAFETAQKWSTGTDLTPRERVHGAVRDLYSRYGETRGADAAGRPMEVDPGRDYDKHFDTHFVEDIKARSIRAAKDLFGQK